MNSYRFSRGSNGFSLIEVLIAVVVLATGLLALGALQASLTANAADARIRSEAVALAEIVTERLRAEGYRRMRRIVDENSGAAWLSGEGDIAELQQGSAATYAISITGAIIPLANHAELTRVDVGVAWQDSAGQARELEMRTMVSSASLTFDPAVITPPTPPITPVARPVVRQADPAGPGVIPIALGTGDSTAASNPTPVLLGTNQNVLVGTQFNVLTYTPTGDTAVIQKRIETTVIKCACQYGAVSTNEIYSKAQWPVVWDGDYYERYEPETSIDAPGTARPSGPRNDVTQSPLCTECCRDRHDDPATTGVAKFDPEDTGAYQKYNWSAGSLVAAVNTTDAQYVDSCRMIRLDGFWRTASDMYARQFGLLETQTIDGRQAKSGLPTSKVGAVEAYADFVKEYLKQYDGTAGTPPGNAEEMFNEPVRGLNAPDTVLINDPVPTDYRYLHARGLYVDHLEPKVRQMIADILADDGPEGRCPAGSDIADCILPYLPFTTINLTEIAKWVASDTSILTVNSGNLLASVPSEPSGSRTIGRGLGDANNTGSVRKSNSGVAVSTDIPSAVDTGPDAQEFEDFQKFQVAGTVWTGDDFFVRVTGGGANPIVFYGFPGDSGECLKPTTGDHSCATSTMLDGSIGGSITLSNYFLVEQASRSHTASCKQPDGQFVTVTATVLTDIFYNYQVSSASLDGVAGTIAAATDDNKSYEETIVTFASIPKDRTVLVGLTRQDGETAAVVETCATNAEGTTMTVTAWTYPWQQ